jgi:hypothetical protein
MGVCGIDCGGRSDGWRDGFPILYGPSCAKSILRSTQTQFQTYIEILSLLKKGFSHNIACFRLRFKHFNNKSLQSCTGKKKLTRGGMRMEILSQLYVITDFT